jgi:hypothetical protein
VTTSDKLDQSKLKDILEPFLSVHAIPEFITSDNVAEDGESSGYIGTRTEYRVANTCLKGDLLGKNLTIGVVSA